MNEKIGSAIKNAVEYLTANPDEARYTDSFATATIESDLRVKVVGPDGASVVTDMPAGVGGGASAPSAGWYMRAAMASCCATVIAMRAAQEGVNLETLEVHVESRSDDRGILGMDEQIPAGPLSARMHVKIAAAGVDPDRLRAIAEWGHFHCPVSDAVKRAVPVALEVETL